VNRTEPVLVDASVWVAASDPDDRSHSAAAELAVAAGTPVAALDLTLYEVANVVGVREGRRTHAAHLVRLIAERCAGNLLHAHFDLLDAATGYAAEHGLSVYDAAYVAAAHSNGWQLVSLDLRDLVSKDLAVTPDAALYP